MVPSMSSYLDWKKERSSKASKGPSPTTSGSVSELVNRVDSSSAHRASFCISRISSPWPWSHHRIINVSITVATTESHPAARPSR